MTFISVFLSGAFHSYVVERPIEKLQSRPSWISLKTDFQWKLAAEFLIEQCQQQRNLLQDSIKVGMKGLPDAMQLFEVDKDETSMDGTYGKLPTVLVDFGHGSIFPIPVVAPVRSSWYQIARSSSRYHALLKKKKEWIDTWKDQSLEKRKEGFSELNRIWNLLNTAYANIAREIRYVENWDSILQEEWTRASEQNAIPRGMGLIEAMMKDIRDPEKLEKWRDYLKPSRNQKPPYLPMNLEDAPAGVITLPIATDITHKKFLLEVEGAVDSHWNQSPWARKNKISFVIRWSFVPKDAEFASGKISLEEHLIKFSKTKAAMTTGALTHFVVGNVLVLGPEKLDARTLAHEIGHLMGFGDCYIRTISSQGIFGLGVLDWTNPLYPDDLMCDNTVGVPRAEVW